MTKVIGVRFRTAGKIYFFAPGKFQIKRGDNVIVETARGIEFGRVVSGPKEVNDEDVVQPLKSVIRMASDQDRKTVEKNKQKEKEAFKICLEKIRKHNLEMKLIDVEYTFDGNKILFYFTADGRIDFRELVKDLAAVFRTRIELRQIGVRDETKIRGGIGICGRPLCCSTYLTEFSAVSIKMAKEQNLSLNPTKISGVCGRLMCCLTNEEETYEMLNSQLPSVGDTVTTKEGLTGTVQSLSVLRKLVKVVVNLENDEKEIREYRRKHWRFSAVRELEIREDIERGELDGAIRILQESKELDSGYPGLVAQYSSQLISIYEAQADEKAYKEELKYYVLECPQQDLAHTQKLKAVCTEQEWEQYREQILQSRNSYSILYPFMEAEGLYERMLECMQKEPFIFNVDKYENVLKKKFPEQMQDIYISYVHKQAERTGDRKRYRELMQYLKKIRRYPGGKEKAAEIAENWRALYYRRSAMMDELQKAGF